MSLDAFLISCGKQIDTCTKYNSILELDSPYLYSPYVHKMFKKYLEMITS